MYCSNDRTHDFSWGENFPLLYNHTSIAYLKRCSGFNSAKRGSMRDALQVAACTVKSRRIQELREKYPQAVLLPVRGKNKLPEALARTIGLSVNTNIRQLQKAQAPPRKDLSAMARLLHKPCFRGSVLGGENYIIVDDIVTQGGTVAALRQFILSKGGFVVAVVALAQSAGSGVLAPSPERIEQLSEKFDYSLLINVLRSYHIADDLREMTNSQIKYLSRFKTMEGLVKKIGKVYGM